MCFGEHRLNYSKRGADMKVHIIGIGGAAAAYLIDLAQANGYEITGSDNAGLAVEGMFKGKKIKVFSQHEKNNITNDIDEVWYSAAVTKESPGYQEINSAHALQIPCLSFAQVAARFFNRANIRIAVAGTHGQSTTTAMLGWVLEKAGLNPTVALGAKLKDWGGNARIGDADIFVIEADEYARRFLEFNPTHTIITSIEQDHFDTYPTEEDYREAFAKLIEQTTHALVINSTYPMSQNIIRGFKEILIKYDHPIKNVKLNIFGKHNLLNATAVYEMAKILGMPHQSIIKGLATFPGIERRFEYIGKVGEAIIYDDYAHHFTEIEATITGAKEAYPGYKIVLIYQPHQAGRLRHQLNETAEAMCIADNVILLPVYQVAGRENNEDMAIATSDELARRVVKLGQEVDLAPNYEAAAKKVRQFLRGKVLIITMGATDVWKVGQILMDNK